MSDENYIPDPTAGDKYEGHFTLECSSCHEWSNPAECDEHGRCPNCAPNEKASPETLLGDSCVGQNLHPCPSCGQPTEGSRGRVTGCKYSICAACMQQEERTVDANIKAVAFVTAKVFRG